METQGFTDDDLDGDDLRPLLASLKFFKAKYSHNASVAGFCFDALRYLVLTFQLLLVLLPFFTP